MERAATEKPRLVQVADKVAARFIFAVVLLALLALPLWWWLDPSRMLSVFVAVLVVSCPCALSLAMPAALTVANGALARRGLLVTRGHAVETLARAEIMVFDKTGTLTEGRLTLAETLPVVGTANEALALAAALEQGSAHPLALALCAAADAVGATTCQVAHADDLRATTGMGVSGTVDGMAWRLGRPDFVAALHGEALPALVAEKVGDGETAIALGSAAGWRAFFVFRDVVRAEAATVVAELKATGLRLAIFSGDAPAAARRIGALLGIEDARGGMLPEDKRDALAAWQHQGAVVAMVGDGVNDAPVLAQAQVSIALGGGADLARTQADMVLPGNRLAALPAAVRLSRRTLRIIRQSLGWAFVYNLGAIPLALSGWVTPWMAGIGMSVSSLLVVLNALRLQKD
jgi:Cu2+-exporting ATPase